MRARSDARGHVELRGPTWWLRRWVTTADPDTGALTRAYRRERLGSIKELRTRAAARAAADDWIERTRPEPLVPGPQILAVAYLRHFDRFRIPLMRPTSQAVYRSVIRKHIAPAVAGHRLVDLDTAWLNRFVGERARTMHRKTLINIRHVLLHLLHSAVKDQFGACRIDTRDVKIPRSAKPAKPQRYFTADELRRIIEASEFPWRALWAVMGYAGLRAGEALALRWDDFDFERRFISIGRNAVRGTVGLPKTASSVADVPILPALAAVLGAYQDWILDERPEWQTGLLFRSRTGAPGRADDVRRHRLQPLLKRLGLAPAGLHAFRHSLPRMLAEQGVSVQTIRQVMRHRSTEQTENYLHNRLDDVWANLEKAALATQQNTAALLHTHPPSAAPRANSGAP